MQFTVSSICCAVILSYEAVRRNQWSDHCKLLTIPAWKQIKEEERFPLNSHSVSRSFLPSSPNTRCFSFIAFFFFLPTFPFSSLKPRLHLVPVCCSQLQRIGMGPGPGPEEQDRSEILETTGLVTDIPQTCNHPHSTLYSPSKHLLSSLAQMLARNVPPHSCLVMPITVYTALRSREREERG